MTTESTAAPQAPAAVPTSVQQTPAAPPAQPQASAAPTTATPTVSAPDAQEPHWLKGRLQDAEERATKKLLKELGVDDPKDAKAALDAYKAAEEARKSDLQKATEKAAAAEAAVKERDSLKGTLKAHATATLSALSEEHRALVVDIAGDDPAKQLETHAKFLARGVFKASAAAPPAATPPAAPAAQTPPPPAALPPPATTAPNAAAPTTTAPPATNRLATWEQLKSTNPLRAAEYRARHEREIAAAEKARKA